MQLLDIKRMARNILENQNIESSFIEYKKSANFKDKILKTACAFANNYMNNEIGLLFIGIEEIDDKETGEKAIPKRPIEGIKESKVEGIENELKLIIILFQINLMESIILSLLLKVAAEDRFKQVKRRKKIKT